MKRGGRRGILCLGLFCSAATILPAAEDLAARVVLLANSDDPDSLRIARHYAEVRGVPAANVIALKLPRTEGIAWREFIATLWRPLLEQLVAEKWIDATPMNLTDAVGRRKYAVNGHRVAALIVCRGVPLKIAHEPDFSADVPPLTQRAEFRTNAGAVDSELSLLATPSYPINAFVPNPLFQNDRPTAGQLGEVIKISRLDGPTADDANALVDRALAAERTGLLGRAYVDLANRDRTGDAMLEAAATALLAAGFDTAVDREPALMPVTARFDAPVLFFGWYAADITGPFNLPGFRFPPGAIALHIHSFSAATLRQPERGWTGPFVARGVTATVGNVHEPYLGLTHRPDLFVRALLRGDTLVDAAYYALHPLSWQAILIGDPLFRPFRVSAEEQMKNHAELPSHLAGYAALRRMRQLDAAGRAEEATALVESAQRERPSLAVAVALAGRLREAGRNEAAGAALEAVVRPGKFESTEWALAREAALLLESGGRASRAVEVWRRLFAAENLPRVARTAWLPEAVQCAAAAKENAQADAWRAEHAALAR